MGPTTKQGRVNSHINLVIHSQLCGPPGVGASHPPTPCQSDYRPEKDAKNGPTRNLPYNAYIIVLLLLLL